MGSFFCLISSALPIHPGEPLSVAAEYYFSHHDFRQAYPLWQEVLKRQPDNVAAVLRVCELQVLFEGRVVCTSTLTQFLAVNDLTLSAENKKMLREKLSSLQSLFLTDEGQSAYYQSLNRIKKKDWSAALMLLNQASVLEKGNLRVLKEKARCEQALGQWEPMQQTWRVAFEAQPFDVEAGENWLESLVYAGQYDRVVETIKKDPEMPKSARQKLAYAVALLETGRAEEALKFFHSAAEAFKPGGPPPILIWGTARALSIAKHSSTESAGQLDKFIRSVSSRPLTEPSWDPYRTSEKFDEATQLQARLRQNPSH